MSGSACRWLGKTAHQQRNTRQGCVDGKTARQPGWKDQVHGGPECRPCDVVWETVKSISGEDCRQEWAGVSVDKLELLTAIHKETTKKQN